MRFQMVKLRHEATVGTELVNNQTGLHSCVLSTGEIVLHGSKVTYDPPNYKFYFFNKDGKQSALPINTLCEHDRFINILSVFVEGKEFLCNSCYICQAIRLIDLKSNKVSIAYQGEIWKMCPGEEGQLYIVHDGRLSILDITSMNFTLKHTFFGNKELFPDHMCYISEFRLLVFSQQMGLFCALDSRNGHVVWNRSNILQEECKCELLGLIYHPKTKMLVIGDYANRLLLVADSQTGQVIQSEPIEGKPFDLHLRGNELVIRYGAVMKLSFYSVRFGGLHPIWRTSNSDWL